MVCCPRIARAPDGQWDIDKTRRRLAKTAQPTHSSLAARGSPAAYSDERLKTNIQPTQVDALAALSAVEVVDYDWN